MCEKRPVKGRFFDRNTDFLFLNVLISGMLLIFLN